MWDSFVQWVRDVTNNPVFISIITILSALGSGLILISKTSIGRKALNSLTELSRQGQAKIESIKAEVDKYKEETTKFMKEKEAELNTFKNELMTKTTVIYNQLDAFENSVFNILSVIPNQKVQGKLEEFKAQWKEQKKTIVETMGRSYTEIDEKFNELEKELNALKEGMKHEERIDHETEEE